MDYADQECLLDLISDLVSCEDLKENNPEKMLQDLSQVLLIFSMNRKVKIY